MKVSELEGDSLDYWVARAIGYIDRHAMAMQAEQPWSCEFSKSWNLGGPILERERINLEFISGEWCAYIDTSEKMVRPDNTCYGPTTLIAAMRCFVSSKFGDEVPDEVTS